MKIENIVDLVNYTRAQWGAKEYELVDYPFYFTCDNPKLITGRVLTRADFETCVAEMTEAAWMDEQPSVKHSFEGWVAKAMEEASLVAKLRIQSSGVENVKSDQVKSPKHYEVVPDVEAKQLIKNTLNGDITKNMTPYQIYCLGNTLKYRLRAGKKDNLQQDIDKAEQYVTMGWGE